MLIDIHPDNPPERKLNMVLDILKNDGVIIYPTDTVYAIGCDMYNHKAIEKLCRVIGKKPETANLSLICYDLSGISEYTTPFSNSIFKMMKRCLPGAYTFILNSNNKVPKLFKNKKKTIGIRVPDNNIPREIVKMLENPIVTASIHTPGNEDEYYTDPALIYEDFSEKVDAVIDGGFGSQDVSTIIDCTGEEMVLIRQGKGVVDVVED